LNLTLLRFELRLNRFTYGVVGLSLMALEFLLVAIFSAARLDQNLAGLYELLPKSIRSLLGGAYLDLLSVEGFLAFGFTHPLAIVLLCAGAIAPASRSAVGGAASGLTDLVLCHPAPRIWVLICRAGAGELAGLGMVFCMWLGHSLGVACIPLPAEPSRLPFLYIALNAYVLFLAVQGLGFLAAATVRFRTSAVGISIAVLVAMLFLSIAAEYWSPLKALPFLSLFNFYKPSKIVFFGVFPWGDIFWLLAFYLSTLGAGLVVFHRRDL
jgi:ABC-type transport system involved in multi-copper enzyme maturation permease subunit